MFGWFTSPERRPSETISEIEKADPRGAGVGRKAEETSRFTGFCTEQGKVVRIL